MSKIVDKHTVEVVKDSKGKISYDKKGMIRSKLHVSDKELELFNSTSHTSCQRYYVNEKLTKDLN